MKRATDHTDFGYQGALLLGLLLALCLSGGA